MALIETIHPKWGKFNLVASLQEMYVRDEKSLLRMREVQEVTFSYPSGRFMGYCDNTMCAQLGHPNEATNLLLKNAKVDLHKIDPEGYDMLRQLLQTHIKTNFPLFLKD